MQAFGQKIGRLLKGGEVIELVGDVGAGKTTFTKGLARGLDIDEAIQSPTFTISRMYDGRDEMRLAHYDFYRLHDAGLMNEELDETLRESRTVTVVEWANAVKDVLPDDRFTITISSPSESVRQIHCAAGGDKSNALLENLS